MCVEHVTFYTVCSNLSINIIKFSDIFVQNKVYYLIIYLRNSLRYFAIFLLSLITWKKKKKKTLSTFLSFSLTISISKQQ